ncbi:Nitroreductase-like protein [Calocera cornea HHB12733]|uniref:Nitroreductase-like protein n=1 Tax=Calocera cornea HHB12733 TaxID=1353952 RepID=A0A165GR00_9BASI|nr:Nitroreductase-like protein [Calocera cornea HHB12733]
MSESFLELVKARRSYYALSNKTPIPAEKITQIVSDSLKYVPSSFNSQSSRVVLLFGKEHEALWDLVLEVLKPVAPPEQYPRTIEKVNACFKSGFGTVLFFEDNAAVIDMQEKFPLYQDRFPTWAQHTSGMLQYIVWLAFEKEGLGASLQHYNPLIDEKFRDNYKLPVTWQLVAQMPFGAPAAEPGEKTFLDMDERFKVFGH